MKRLFFALWPDRATRLQCSRVLEKQMEPDFRPVSSANLHVTLLFLGSVNSEQEADISAGADAVLLPPTPMVLIFDRLDYWKKPGVLCLTSRDFDQRVTVLAKSLTDIAIRYGVRIDERRFCPHVTLARKVRRTIVADFEPVVWQAEDFCLVESCPLADGVAYRVIRRWGRLGVAQE